MNFYKLLNKYKSSFFSITLIIVILISLNSALLKDVVYESDDYFLHATRIGNYYLALKQGQLPVRWGPNLNQSYGYPAFNYMYHTPYITGAFIHSLGFSIQESLNLVVLFAIILGGSSCYFLARSYIRSESWSVLLALFFLVNPYTLLTIYWRGAIGELFFYAVVPLFLLGLKKKNFLLVTVSTLFLVLSHLPSLVLLTLIAILFLLTEFKDKLTFQRLSPILSGGITGILLSAWYWIPAIFEQWMVQYQESSSLSQYKTQFVPLTWLFDITKSFQSSDHFLNVLTLGGVNILALFLILYVWKYNRRIVLWLIAIGVSLFLISPSSEVFWDQMKLLQYIQYPWRFLWVITLSSIVLFLHFIREKKINKLSKKIVFIVIVFGVIASSQKFIKTKGSTSRSDFDWYHPVADTGSSFNEHNPIWSNMPYYFPEELLYINATESALLNTQNTDTFVHKLSELHPEILRFDGRVITYEVFPNQDIITLHKRLFYPGWEAYLDKKNVNFVENIPEYTGVLAVSVPANKKTTVSIIFSGYTKTRKLAELISFLTLFEVVGYYLLKKL